MTLAWLPYADPAEAERRLGGIPEGITVDCYRADGEPMPDSITDVEFYVLPYMKGAEVLERSGEMSSLQVVQTLTAGVENFVPHVPDGVTLRMVTEDAERPVAETRTIANAPASCTASASARTERAAARSLPWTLTLPPIPC